jgi:hypothetical protein
VYPKKCCFTQRRIKLSRIRGSHGGEYEDRWRCPDDGGSKDLWNVGKLLPDYTVLQPRRQQSRIKFFGNVLALVHNTTCLSFLYILRLSGILDTTKTNSMQQSPFREAESHSAGQEFFTFCWTRRLLPCSQRTATRPCAEPNEYSPYPHSLVL